MKKRENPTEKAALAVHTLRRLTDDLDGPRMQLSNTLHGMREQIRRITERIPMSERGGTLIAHIDTAIEHLNCMELGGICIEANHYRDEAWDRINP